MAKSSKISSPRSLKLQAKVTVTNAQILWKGCLCFLKTCPRFFIWLQKQANGHPTVLNSLSFINVGILQRKLWPEKTRSPCWTTLWRFSLQVRLQGCSVCVKLCSVLIWVRKLQHFRAGDDGQSAGILYHGAWETSRHTGEVRTVYLWWIGIGS